MKEIILKNYKLVVLIIVFILTIGFFINSNLEKERQIVYLGNKIIEEENKKSDEESLIDMIKLEKDKITEYKNSIKVLELNLEESNKTNSCLKSQLDRLVEGLEYSLDYCKGNNLDKFQGLE